MKNLIYKSAIGFAENTVGQKFTSGFLEKYLVPDKRAKKPSSLNGIFRSLLSSAQNLQMSPEVIGRAISGERGNIEPLGKFLNNFSPKETAENYGMLSDQELLNRILPTLVIQPHPTKRTLWLRYCKTIISASHFFSQYKCQDDFYGFIERYYSDVKIKSFLPLLLSYEIDGIGFALACDFLKELGYVKYGKPDTHIKDIFIELGLLKGVSKVSSKADYLSLKIMDELAEINGVTTYAVDKVLWLICTGDYYLDGFKTSSQKKAFIVHMKEKANNAML